MSPLRLVLSLAVCLSIPAGAVHAQQLFNDDFTTTEGHSDTVSITGTNNWSAQSNWVAADTVGSGYASCATAWTRAMTFTRLGASLGVYDTVSVQAVWRGEGLLSSPGAADVFAIGISDSTLAPGDSIPALRVDVSLGADDTLRFGSDADYIAIDLVDAYTGANTNTNWYQITMAITRMATADTFSITLSVEDLDSATVLGSVTYQATNSATYQAADLYPAMRTLSMGGGVFTASHVDRFTASKVQLAFNDDFTTTEGHSYTASITGTNSWSAQSNWVAADTVGSGYASCATAWTRAMNFTRLGASMGINDTVSVQAVWRGEGLLSSPGAADVFAIGISDSALNSGNSVPALRVDVSLGADDTLRFGSGADYIAIDLADAYTGTNTDTNWYQITMTITRMATADTFSITLSVEDLGSATTLGSITYQASDSATYQAANLYPAMRNLNMGGAWFTASHVDRFTVFEVQPTRVSVDLSRQLFIGGVSDFSRKQFVNWHDTATINGYSQAEAKYLFNDLDMRIARSVGRLSWIRSQVTTEQPGQPGYINSTEMANYCLDNQDSNLANWPETLYPGMQREDLIITDHTEGIPHEPDAGETSYVPSSLSAAANWHSLLWQNHWTSAGRPTYLEPVNEPFVNMTNYFKPGTTDNVDEQYVIDFHSAIIDQLDIDMPSVKVGGPCSAFPEFSKWDYDHFRDRIGLFINDVGDRADFVSWHIYSTHLDDQNNVMPRTGSNVEYMLDLVENYANNAHGAPLPVIISEFGGGVKSGTIMSDNYSPQRDWHILKYCTAKSLQFFQRPDRIEKIIPFIVGKATWHSGNDSYPFVIYRRPDGPGGSQPYEETHLTKYYKYLKGLVGQQFPIISDDPDIITTAIVNGSEANLLIASIDEDKQHLLDLSTVLESGTSVSSATVTRLYWNGSTPVFSEDVPISDWQSLLLRPYEFLRIKLNLSQMPARFDQLHRNVYYGDRTIVEYTGSAETVNIAYGSDLSNISTARLRVGVTRPHSESPIPNVIFNGQALTAPRDWTGMGQDIRDQFDGAIVFDVPANLVQAANTAQVSFPTDVAGDYFSSVVLEVEQSRSVEELDLLFTMSRTENNFTLDWETMPDVTYQVHKATTLPSFSPYEEPISGNGSPVQIIIPANGVKAFFKVTAITQ